MADALMNWDKLQPRWRKKYKKVPLQISAADLGGTNYTDTLAAANQWFREQKARIDRELAVKTFRPNELEYRAELENLQASIKSLVLAIRVDPKTEPMLAPKIELLKQRAVKIREILQKTTPLPPLDDRLRNPLNISPDRIENEATQEAIQAVSEMLREKDISWVSDEEIADSYDTDGMDTIYQRSQWNAHAGNVVERAMERAIESRIQEYAEAIAGLQSELVRYKKEELGLIDNEYDRGTIVQMLKEQGIEVAEPRQLAYHIDKFIELQRRKCAEEIITPDRLATIIAP